MFEKVCKVTHSFEMIIKAFLFLQYSALVPGLGGDGGEYNVQVGFGWSNGVILDLFRIYGHDLTKDPRKILKN